MGALMYYGGYLIAPFTLLKILQLRHRLLPYQRQPFSQCSNFPDDYLILFFQVMSNSWTERNNSLCSFIKTLSQLKMHRKTQTNTLLPPSKKKKEYNFTRITYKISFWLYTFSIPVYPYKTSLNN